MASTGQTSAKLRVSKGEGIPSLLICMLLAIGFGVLYYVSPMYADDFWYATGSRGMDPWNAFLECCQNAALHLQYDTGRLANLVSPPFLSIFPRWVFAVIYTAAMFVIFTLGARCFRASPMSRALWVTFIVFLLPWNEFMFATIYALNYVVTSVFAIVVLWAFFRLAGDQPIGRGAFLLSVASAFLAGWFHEGFSAPMLCGLFVYDCAVRWRMPRRMWILQGALFAGLVVLISFPALWARAEHGNFRGLFDRPLLEMMAGFGVFDFMLLLFTGIFCWQLISGRLRGVRNIAESLVILVFGLVSVVFLIKYYNGPRTMWFSQLVCGLGVFRLLSAGRSETGNKEGKKLGKIFSLACYLICLVNLVAAIVVQVRLTREFKEVLTEYEASPNGVIYKDVMTPKFDLSLFKTSVRNLNSNVSLTFINYYYKDTSPIVILPASLRDFDPTKEQPVLTDPFPVYLHRNEIVAAVPKVEATDIYLDFEGHGVIKSRFRQKQFVIAGDTLTYIYPHTSSFFNNPVIRSLSFTE